MKCLICGDETEDCLFSIPGTKIAKKRNEMRPDGCYYFAICFDCKLCMPQSEWGPFMGMLPERLVHGEYGLERADLL